MRIIGREKRFMAAGVMTSEVHFPRQGRRADGRYLRIWTQHEKITDGRSKDRPLAMMYFDLSKLGHVLAAVAALAFNMP